MATRYIPCSVDGCKGSSHYTAKGARGWCAAHYQQWRVAGDPVARAARPPQRRCIVAGCESNHHAKGYCAAHFFRWKRWGDPLLGGTSPGNSVQFFEHVCLPFNGDECLLWPFGHNGAGYARLALPGRGYVHRLLCEAVHGPAPSNKHEAAHICGRGADGCVNKRHLVWKTHKENMADQLVHGTRAFGEKNGNSVLTERDIRTIRSLSGKALHREIAAQFGVARGTVSDIIGRRRWGHLT